MGQCKMAAAQRDPVSSLGLCAKMAAVREIGPNELPCVTGQEGKERQGQARRGQLLLPVGVAWMPVG